MLPARANLSPRMHWRNRRRVRRRASGRSFVYNPRFPGQYFDAETGLNYNYARDYDPAVGRYIEGDPIGMVKDYSNPSLQVGLSMLDNYEDPDPEALNSVYSYVYSDPVSWFDDNGLEPKGGHTSGKRPSTQEKHEQGDARRARDQGGEKADRDRRPPRKHPQGWKGPWPSRGSSFLPFMINPCLWAPQLMPLGSCNPPPGCSSAGK